MPRYNWLTMLRLFANCCNNAIKSSHAKNTRTFLSEAYKCTEAWNNRLNLPILQKVRIEELYNTIDQRFSRNDLVSAIDIDIFVNSISDDNYLSELRDILHKLRLTMETGKTLQSTQYTAIRCFMDNGQYDQLVEILDDRLNYGLFLDEFTGNILLDELIKIGNFSSAAKVASFFMLQEDFENNEITESLCMYACLKYLSTLQPETVAEIKVEPVVEAAPTKKKKKEEEVKVRVGFIRNPFFDDHFNLNDLKLLAGKTLVALTKNNTDAFSLNCQLIGWLYYKKVDKMQQVSKLIKDKNMLLKDFLKVFKDAMELAHIKDDPETFQACTEILADLENTKCVDQPKSMEETLIENIKLAISKSEEENIQRHSQVNIISLLLTYVDL